MLGDFFSLFNYKYIALLKLLGYNFLVFVFICYFLATRINFFYYWTLSHFHVSTLQPLWLRSLLFLILRLLLSFLQFLLFLYAFSTFAILLLLYCISFIARIPFLVSLPHSFFIREISVLLISRYYFYYSSCFFYFLALFFLLYYRNFLSDDFTLYILTVRNPTVISFCLPFFHYYTN